MMDQKSPFETQSVSEWLFTQTLCCLQEAAKHGSMCPTLMLTGLPESKYTQQDVATLVWPYLFKQNLHSLYYNVIVLPLQRRVTIETDQSKWWNKDNVTVCLFLTLQFFFFLTSPPGLCVFSRLVLLLQFCQGSHCKALFCKRLFTLCPLCAARYATRDYWGMQMTLCPICLKNPDKYCLKEVWMQWPADRLLKIN